MLVYLETFSSEAYQFVKKILFCVFLKSCRCNPRKGE